MGVRCWWRRWRTRNQRDVCALCGGDHVPTRAEGERLVYHWCPERLAGLRAWEAWEGPFDV